MVTYYLAIEKIPGLQIIFPSFFTYVAIVTSAGIPLLVLAGYIHFKKIPTYTSELDIGAESNQWIFKLQPGYMIKVTYPMHRMMTIMMLKLLNNEKLGPRLALKRKAAKYIAKKVQLRRVMLKKIIAKARKIRRSNEKRERFYSKQLLKQANLFIYG